MRRSAGRIDASSVDSLASKLLLAGGVLLLAAVAAGAGWNWWEVRVASAARAGNVQLPAGRYSVIVDRDQAVFTAAGSGKTYSVPIAIEKSAHRYDQTLVESKSDNNTEIIDSIALAGTTTKLRFVARQPSEQKPAPGQASQSSNPVRLNVAAMDASGRPVTDLSAADFRLVDNGRPQTIASVRPREPRPWLPGTSGQHSNRSAAAISHATVIVFDMLNMRLEDRGFVITQIVHTLQPFESSDNLFLYLLGVDGHLYPVHGLPGTEGDTARDAAWPSDIQSKLMEAMQVSSRQRPLDLYNYYPLRRVHTTIDALAMIAAGLTAAPGRQSMVWISQGVPIALGPTHLLTHESADFSPFVYHLSDMLNHADVSIYGVQPSPPTTRPRSGTSIPYGLDSEETLDLFARLTGGRAYETDVATAIKQAMHNATEQSYLVVYTPPPANWDGKYHKINITCTRKGVRLETRQGYFAFADPAEFHQQQAEFVLEAATKSPFDAAGIGLNATAAPLAGIAAVRRLVVRIDPADVQLLQADGSYTGQLAVRYVEYQDDGTPLKTQATSVDLHLTREQRDAAMKEGYLTAANIGITPQVRKVRVIMLDNNSGAVGSLSIPVSK